MREVEPEFRESERVRELCRTLIRCADDEALMLALVRDLFSAAEIRRAANRLAAAEVIAAGQSIRETATIVGVSPGTVTRMRRWVRSGTGGVATALQRRTIPPDDSTVA